ncbi:uncharacterized protein LOC131651198 [Vicia villosa]|uniref:uncharacterized protein LOC131651198 n=1 Tax=Vicia villosa TaxID=3911 RepID=UPI00273AC1A0|nr:uncharacterized protein LOC131651198 [Vicia villosa]
MSIGGRVTLINLVLNAISSFTFSFYKAPRTVIKEIRSILRNFLWSSKAIKKSIHWVKWETDSIWWRDVINNDGKNDFNEEGFTGCVRSTIKKGNLVPFWFGLWLGDQILCVKFPELYDISINKFCAVDVVYYRENDEVVWQPSVLFEVAFAQQLPAASSTVALQWQQLVNMLSTARPDRDGEDGFSWRPNHGGEFTVASLSLLIAESKEIAWLASKMILLKEAWKSIVPIKIQIFMWRMFISRLPTKDLLFLKGVNFISSNLLCEFCRCQLETPNHLFFLCFVSKDLWGNIYSWMGEDLPFTLEEVLDFGIIQEKVKSANIRKKINTIWFATSWCIWIMRNAIIFDNVSYSFDKVYFNILYFSWSWLASSNPLSPPSF